MVERVVLAVIASVGCGRIWFDEVGDGGTQGGSALVVGTNRGLQRVQLP